ncbi:MAG: DUF6261 family protein [Tannerellaceae bacterium]|jgi:hypothetical protein|nr:DUF6261 family protein [Tannerellaceae bacterium]
MQKFIAIPFKTVLKTLYIGEHFNFYESSIIIPLEALLDNLPTMKEMLDALKSSFAVEDTLFKRSQASIFTPDIARLNDERVAYFIFLWRCIEMADLLPGADVKHAADRLKFLHHTYKDLPEMNYYDMSGAMTNFLQDCETAVYQQATQTLSSALFIDLAHYINRMKAVHDNFMELHQKRSISREHVAEMGRLSEVRFDVDAAFAALIDSANVSWTANEMGAQDAVISHDLLAVKEVVDAAIHQAQFVLAHRGFHRKKKEDKEDVATETASAATTSAAPNSSAQSPTVSHTDSK